MTLEIFIQITYVQAALSAVVTLMAFLFYRKRLIESKLIGLIFLVSFLASISPYILPLRGLSVNIPATVFNALNLLSFIWLFHYAFNCRYTKLLSTIAVIFGCCFVVNFLFIQKNEINTYSWALRAVVLIAFSIYFYYRLLINLPVKHIQRVPMFWFNAAILIYNAGTLFLFLFTSYLVNVLHDNLLIYWSLHNVFNIIQHLIIMIGLWVDLKNIKSQEAQHSQP